MPRRLHKLIKCLNALFFILLPVIAVLIGYNYYVPDETALIPMIASILLSIQALLIVADLVIGYLIQRNLKKGKWKGL